MQTLLTKDNKIITIRPATETDAAAIISFAKELFAATDQVATTLEEFNPTVLQEIDFINNHNKPGALMLVAVCGDDVVGLLNFNCYPKIKMKHAGEFGVSVSPAFQQNGIGKAMIEELISWAKGQKVEKIFLEVMHTNRPAIKLYEDLGFVSEGKKLKVIKQPDGSYADLIVMGCSI